MQNPDTRREYGSEAQKNPSSRFKVGRIETLARQESQQYDCHVELAVILVIVALWVPGSLVPAGHILPEEIAMLKRRERLHLPYTKEIKVIYRIWATWRVENVTPNSDALTQHFEVLEGSAPYYQTRKML